MAAIKGAAFVREFGESVLNVILETPGPRGRLGLPALVWSAPGTAKTDKIERHCFHRRHQFKSMSPAEGEAAYGVVPAVRKIADQMIEKYGLEKFLESGMLDGLCIGSPPPEWALPFLADEADGTELRDASSNCRCHTRAPRPSARGRESD
jgi:hypothetical protein